MKTNLIKFSLCMCVFLFGISAVYADGTIDAFNREHGSFFHVYSAERTDLRVGYLYEPDAKESSAGTTGSKGSFDLQNIFLNFSSVFALSEDSFFSLGGDFESRRYQFSTSGFGDGGQVRSSTESLYKIAFSPGFGTFLTDSILAWGTVTIGNYSDLQGGAFSKDDYQLLGEGRLIFQINPGAQIIVGASYTNTYLDQRLLPIFGLRLLSESGKLHIAIDLPLYGRIGYYFTPYIEGFGQVVVTGDRYRTNVSGEDLTIGVHDERVGVGVRFWLGSYVSLTLEGGRTIDSQLRFMKVSSPIFSGDGSLDMHWYGRAYLGLAF